MRRWLYVMAASIFLVPTTGCAAGMHGMHSMHGSPRHGATTIVKEVRNEQVAVTLTIPPLVPNRESVLQIAARHAVTNEPLVDAGVTVTVRGLGGGDSSAHMARSRQTSHRTQTSESVAVQQEAPGTYRAPYTFRSSGLYEINVAVSRGGEASAPTLIEFAATQEVVDDQHGARPSKAWIILGGTAMAAMMVLRWVVF